jgi:hypothetical protein
MTLQVRKCCEDMPVHKYKVNADGTIDMEEDQEYDTLFPDVLYCMYCGNRLQLEPTPETKEPEPYKPDLSSLSAKDRALEELKEEMQK